MRVLRKARQLSSPRGLTLAVLYSICLVGLGGSLLAYTVLIPRNLDLGIAVAARALAYKASFAEVDRARRELAAGSSVFAEERLLRFLRKTERVQRSQLQTHAVAQAYELLSQIYLSSNRPGRAVRHLEVLTDRLPLYYRAWLLRGQAEKAAGDLTGASASLDQAFRLSLIDLEVVEAYLQVLAEQSDYARVLWVQDQFLRAERRAAPTALVKIGVAENPLQNWVLDKVGIPIEHGRFFRGFEKRGLLRGDSRSFVTPTNLFKEWPTRHEGLVIQICFEHVGEVRINKVQFETKRGEVREVPLHDEQVRYLHRRHSVSEYYAEFEIDVHGQEVESLEVFYSTPSRRLSDSAIAIVDKAHANRAWKGGAF